MGGRVEDLIDHYLADLLVATDEPVPVPEANQATPNEPSAAPLKHIKNTQPEQASTPVPQDAGLMRTQESVRELIQKTIPKPTQEPTFTPPALAEPARQQLQQLLNSAWPAPVLAEALETSAANPIPPPAPQVNPAPPQAITPSAPAPAGRPAWANQAAFDSLIIEVAGLKLAIPLLVLGQIFQADHGFTHLPGQSPLFLGTLETPRGPLRVINTALLVMPERYDARFIDDVRFVVSLAGASPVGSAWQLALAVTRVAQPVSLRCDDVLWRSERSKRPWLLGTVKSQMCALLDATALGACVA
ncbi:MAG: hypothetical protein RL497_864 [Pseudomonadota bacterium]|jgi:purine-binding chemotaxis protein CheW